MINSILARHSEQLFQSFMDSSSDGIFITDTGGCVLDVNRKFEELHGWSKAEVVGRFLPMIPQHLREESMQLNRRIVRGEEFSGMDLLLKRKDSSLFYGSVTVFPIRNASNQIIALGGIERDISEKKRAESELIERERQFRKLIKLNPEPIILHDDGIIRSVNDSCANLLKLQIPETVAGRTLFDFLDDRGKSVILAQMEEVMVSDEYTKFQEMQLTRDDGTKVDVEVSSVYIHKNMGQPIIQTVIRDITQRKKSEETIRNSEKLSMIGQLAAGIAHDIRNPLTSLKGFIQLQKARGTDYSDIMLEEIEHIHAVVNEFMALAKPHIAIFCEVSIRKLIDDVVHFLNPQALLCNVQFKIQFPTENLMLYCVPDQIKQVFINIIKNAIEAMPGGGGITIDVLKKGNNRVVFRISDQGVGIPEDQLSRIGEPFFSMKDGGNGLGWMISKRIVDDHKGHVSITSKINQGTTVNLEFPLNRELVDSGLSNP